MTGQDTSDLLSGRVCAERISNYPNGCIGEHCSKYEFCLSAILEAKFSIDYYEKHPTHARLNAGRKWGDRR